MGGCPKCGVPVADEDLACRQCGQSFLGDPNAVHEALLASAPPASAYTSRSAPPAFVRAPVPFGGGMLPNPYARPEPLPGSPGGPTTRSEANKALFYALFGFFCVGFAFGWVAIKNARRVLMVWNVDPSSRARAQLAFWIGWLDIGGWAYGLIRLLFLRHHY